MAAATDWLDGYLARTLNQTSAFGAFLDPVADKLMVAAALILLVVAGACGCARGGHHHRSRDRDFGAARVDGEDRQEQERGRQLSRQDQDRSRRWPRSCCCCITGYYSAVVDTQELGTVLIYVAAGLTLWSMAYYLKMAMPFVLGKQE